MTRLPLPLAPLIASLTLSACAPHGQVRYVKPDEQVQDHPKAIPLSHYEATFDPSEFDEEINEAEKPRERQAQETGSEAERDSIVVESEVIQGFRIQIFATANIDEANAMRMTAAQRVTEDSVYVVFDPPVYKVRLGDFRTRIEANQRLASLVEHGFPDAWVVSDRITSRRLVRIPSTDSLDREH